MHFSEVLGQEAIKSRLKTAITSNHLAHAQLFVGAEGSGTLAMALALAREVLCSAEGLTEEQKRAGHLKMDPSKPSGPSFCVSCCHFRCC